MTGGTEGKDTRRTTTEEELDPMFRDPRVMAWFGEHLTELRGSASGHHFLYWTLGIGFVVGLAAYVGGYLLRPSPTTEPLGLVSDLLYTLGWALWTGVVVVVFLQVLPEVKRRQIERALDAYEAVRREKGGAGSDQASGGAER